MEDSGEWWYDKSVGVGDIADPTVNADMLSPPFWLVKSRQFKITRSDDPQHTALLQTTGDCLSAQTFRAKITSYRNFRNVRLWASEGCQGNCTVQYGSQSQATDRFGQATCNGSLQHATQFGFWCDWDDRDGAVLIIDEGGTYCGRADHGIAITEASRASFLEGSQLDLLTYSLNLWVN